MILRTDILQKKVAGCTCYHPFSIIPVIAKVFERIVDNQGYNYLRWRTIRYIAINLGFEVFTLLWLLEATNNWSCNIDRYKVNAVLFLDSKKALILLITRSCCQNSMHIRFRGLGCASNWIRTFLKGRNQKCFANTPVKQVTYTKSLCVYIDNTTKSWNAPSSSQPQILRLVLGLLSVFEIIFQPQCGNLFSNLFFETPFLITVALLGTVAISRLF